MSISRRDFIATAAVTGIAAAAVSPKAGAIPTRPLGKTGVRVSQLVFGSGSRWLMYEEEEKAAEAVRKALDLGINYVDTAYGYGNGKSEERLGRILGDRRKDLFLATKVNVRKGDEAKRMIEGSLKRLQTDHFDLLHIHSLTTPQDLADIEAKGNVLDVLHQMRDQKVTRFIGITCHTDPAVLKTAAGAPRFRRHAVRNERRPDGHGQGGHQGKFSVAGAARRQSEADGRDRDENIPAGKTEWQGNAGPINSIFAFIARYGPW